MFCFMRSCFAIAQVLLKQVPIFIPYIIVESFSFYHCCYPDPMTKLMRDTERDKEIERRERESKRYRETYR